MLLELNLPRWIFASASKFFNDTIAGTLPMYFEGQSRRTDNEQDYLEFRLDGPYVQELSKDYFKVEFEINILVVSHTNGNDFHKLYRDCGIALNCFKPFSIFKLGDGIDDTGDYIECATIPRSKDQREAIRVSHFGKIDPVKPVVQSSVEGHYHFFVTR